MIKKILVIIFFLSIFQNIYAEEKLAVVDIDYLINNSKAGKYIQTTINKINDKSLAEFKKKEKEFKEKQTELISQKNVLSKEEFNKKGSDLNKRIKDYNLNKKKLISESNQKKSKAIAELLTKINKLLIEYAEQNKVSFIIDKKNIILTITENEITKEIFEVLNKKYDKIKIN